MFFCPFEFLLTMLKDHDYNLIMEGLSFRKTILWELFHRQYGSLNNVLAQKLFSRLVNENAEREGITEKFKETNQLAWVRKTNNIQAIVCEIVNIEVVFT